MSHDTIRVFAISKLGWIKRQQTGFREQERESPRDFLERESHYVWGRRYLLAVDEVDRPPNGGIGSTGIVLGVRPGIDHSKRQRVMEEWYREMLKKAATPLIAKWEWLIGIKVKRFYVQRMKTKWGSCNAEAGTIRINTDLAKKPLPASNISWSTRWLT